MFVFGSFLQGSSDNDRGRKSRSGRGSVDPVEPPRGSGTNRSLASDSSDDDMDKVPTTAKLIKRAQLALVYACLVCGARSDSQ